MGKTYLITGGAGFVGSSLALFIKRDHADARVVALDNLKRRGSELNLKKLKAAGVEFSHGDIRNPEDLEGVGPIDFLIECSAEPSVMAGVGESPRYLINTNLNGTINCLELARRYQCPFVFLSTSRVYPVAAVNDLNFNEAATRFEFSDKQKVHGASKKGIAEDFTLTGTRTLYGATKLSSELIIAEYSNLYGFPAIVNRCGVLSGPGQMGKIDQGVMVLWVAAHVYGDGLSYVGFGGRGKQVRDVLHVADLYDLIRVQLREPQKFTGRVFNVGGGAENAVSLCELTKICEEITGKKIKMGSDDKTRIGDIKWFVTDNTRITDLCGWRPIRRVSDVVKDIHEWIVSEKDILKSVLSRK